MPKLWETLISGHLVLAASVTLATAAGFQSSRAAEPEPVKIAIFDFELDDRSAAGGMIGPDAVDAENLKKATDEARQRLAASGRYLIVHTSGAVGELTSAAGLQGCDGCEAALAKKLGADQSMIGFFARVRPHRIHASDRGQGHQNRHHPVQRLFPALGWGRTTPGPERWPR